MSWNQGASSSFNARGGVQPVFNVNQWSHYCTTVDQWGGVSVSKNGRVRAVGSGGGLPLFRERRACRLGMDFGGAGGGFQGAMAAFHFWDRGLSAAEVAQLAADVPANLRGATFDVVGVPRVAQAGAVVTPVRLYPSLVTAHNMRLSLLLSAGGTVTPSPLAWSTESGLTATVSLTLPALPAGESAWTLSFAISGVDPSLYALPAPYTIYQQNYGLTLGDAIISLDFSTPSAHAGFATSENGAGYATFNGQQVRHTHQPAPHCTHMH